MLIYPLTYSAYREIAQNAKLSIQDGRAEVQKISLTNQ